MNCHQIAAKLQQYRFTVSDEAQLQLAVAEVLKRAGIEFEREYILSGRDRIDFYVPKGHIGIEIKVDGSAMAVASQIGRYATHEKIKKMILFTTRRKHRSVPV